MARKSRAVALGKVNLVLALLGLLALAGAYRLMFMAEALALLVLAVALVTVVSQGVACSPGRTRVWAPSPSVPP